MKSHTIKVRQDNMLCHECLINIVKALSRIQGIEELNIDLETKSIKLKYNDDTMTRRMVLDLINRTIENGEVIGGEPRN